MLESWIDPDDQRWLSFLESARHDVYHLPEYVKLCAAHEGGEPVAFHIECSDGALLAPMLLRRIPRELQAPDAWRDSVTPYGYTTLLVTPGISTARLEQLLKRFRALAREREIIACFFRLHPILVLSQEALEKAGQIVDHGQTVSIDLRLNEHELQTQMRKSHRYEIRKLKNAGFVATMDDWSRLGEFAELYLANMTRVSASRSLRFPESHFVGLRDLCGEQFHFCTVLSETGELASAGLFAETCGIVQFHLGASSERFRAAAPSKLMLDAVTRWARSRGDEIFHLGGGLENRDDALFRFKAGFSKSRHRFTTYRMVMDDDRYGELTEHWKTRSSISEIDSQFFPLYRKPMANCASR